MIALIDRAMGYLQHHSACATLTHPDEALECTCGLGSLVDELWQRISGVPPDVGLSEYPKEELL